MTEITDDHSSTIMVLDVPAAQAVHWMSPHDATVDDLIAIGSDSATNHPGIFLAAFADGRTIVLSANVELATRRAMLTVAGGEEIDSADF